MLDFPEQYGDEDQIEGSSGPGGGASWDAIAFSVPQRPQSAPLSDHRSLLGQPSGHVGDGMMWSVAGVMCNAMNGLVMMPSKTCTATREAMRKEDEAGEEFEATAH